MKQRKRNTRNLTRLAVGLVVASLLAVGFGVLALAVSAQSFRKSGVIAKNVTIAGVAVGGLGSGEAQTRLETEWVPTLPKQVKLTAGGQDFAYTREELGATPQLEAAVKAAARLGRQGGLLQQITDRLRLMQSSVDVPVAVAVDKPQLRARMAEVAAKVNRPPHDARITVTGEEQVEVVPGQVGCALREAQSAAAVEKALKVLSAAEVPLVTEETKPNITAEDLAHLEVVLGSYATPYESGKVDRSHNLSLAIKAINAKVIMPDEVFSANAAIGPRDEARGFRDAPIFVNGEITPSTGGGICQIATTIYNAALLAGLPVTERHHHSMPVHYADAGRDATVYWGQLDLRFRNDTGGPIVLLAAMDGDRVHVRLIGRRAAKKKVRVERTGVSSLPFQTVGKPDPTLDLGKKKVAEKGRKGIRVTAWRIIEQPDGTEKREELHTDVYQPYKQVVLMGTKPLAVPPGTTPGTIPGAVGPLALGDEAGAAPGGKPAAKPAVKPAPKPAGKPATKRMTTPQGDDGGTVTKPRKPASRKPTRRTPVSDE
jgi:vancomycin resistance protein YoaR